MLEFFANLAPSLVGLEACAGVHSGLGIAATKQLLKPSEGDRVYGWTLWWFLDRNRYNEAGQRLCLVGGVVFVAAVASWVGCVLAVGGKA